MLIDSAGGFAHVYLVRLSRPINGNDVAVLKRVAVADKEQLSNMRTEVETMVCARDVRQERHANPAAETVEGPQAHCHLH